MNNRMRYWEVWDVLKARLASARMLTILQGGKVYLEGDDYSQPEGPEDKPWGRLVIVPGQNLWPDEPGIGPTSTMSFLTRAEGNPITNPGFNLQKLLDGIQDECYSQLAGFTIPKMNYVMGALPIWLNRPAQPLPLWDDSRGLGFTSAEWRTELASVVSA
jgi:hypothetical protein